MSEAAPQWYTRKEAAAFLCSIGCPISPKTLSNLASNDNRLGGPSFTRVRWNVVRYTPIDLRHWAERQARRVP